MATEGNNISVIASKYDRLKELKEFDESKAGVKGLVDNGVTKIPRIFITPSDNPVTKPISEDVKLKFPVIDLEGFDKDVTKRNNVIEEVRRATETWGFFLLLNHGIPTDVLDEMIEGVRRFNEQPNEVKAKYYSRDLTKKVVYNTNFDLYQAPATNWRDTIFFIMAPDHLNPEELPEACRDIIIDYSKHITGLGSILLELLSEGLGLKPNHLKDMDCAEGLLVVCHYYPACPEPELTLGASKHSDNSFLTILLQDQIGGLQVLHKNQWIDVPPIPGSLVINIGDALQLVSNDRLKSSEQSDSQQRRSQNVSGMFSQHISSGINKVIWSYQRVVIRTKSPYI